MRRNKLPFLHVTVTCTRDLVRAEQLHVGNFQFKCLVDNFPLLIGTFSASLTTRKMLRRAWASSKLHLECPQTCSYPSSRTTMATGASTKLHSQTLHAYFHGFCSVVCWSTRTSVWTFHQHETFECSHLKFMVSGWSKQTSIHTRVHNAVTLVWGSLRFAPVKL